MRHHSFALGLSVIALGLLAGAEPARAASNQTWVSPSGGDAAACTIDDPCQTFQGAYAKTNPGGVISVRDAGEFGPLNITKAINVIAEGVEARINTAAGGAHIIVNAPSDAVVVLRGLIIDGFAGANTGISFVAGAALHVQNGFIRMTTNGIKFAPATGTSELYVTDTTVARPSTVGILVAPTGSGGAKAMLDRVRVENSKLAGISFSGKTTTGSVTATVRESVASGNATAGIVAAESGSGQTKVLIDRTASANNGVGVVAEGAGATIRIGDSTVSGNSTGLLMQTSGVIASFGSNEVIGNGTENDPNGTPVLYQ